MNPWFSPFSSSAAVTTQETLCAIAAGVVYTAEKRAVSPVALDKPAVALRTGWESGAAPAKQIVRICEFLDGQVIAAGAARFLDFAAEIAMLAREVGSAAL